MWHCDFAACVKCRDTRSPHAAKGLCELCYSRDYRENPKNRKRIVESKEDWRQRNMARFLAKSKADREQRNFDGLREEILKRDGHACVKCGSRKRLVVHHKDGNGRGSANPNNSLDNLVTECRACHLAEHRQKVSNSRRLSVLKKWAHHHDRCKECKTSEKKHYAHGLCVNCNARQRRRI